MTQEPRIPASSRPAEYSDKPTHAICRRHGRVLPIDADDHSCSWIRLIARSSSEPQHAVEVEEVPETCQVCEAGDIVWSKEAYRCAECGVEIVDD